jgi:indolepyruvate decarboxylase
MNVADYLIERLTQIGVGHVFTVPGDYCGPFLDALDAADSITRVANVNELGSGYAADGYARVNGVGAACVQYGVGNFSLLNCTAGSFVERLPVVVISSSPSTKDRLLEETKRILFHHSTGDLRADQLVMQHVTAASMIVVDPIEAPAQIDGALRAMLTEHRPAYIEVITDVWKQDCSSPAGAIEALKAVSDDDALDAAVEAAWIRIRGARLPVIWAGVQIQRLGLQGVLQRLVDASGMPFTTTSLGKTVLDESQKSFIGTYSGPASPALTRAVMKATDCPVALGTIITDDYLNIMASTDKGGSYEKMVEVNLEEARVGHQYYHLVTLEDFLAALVARFEAEEPVSCTLPDPEPEDVVPPSEPGDHLTYNVFYRELGGYLEQEGLKDQVTLILGESTSLYVWGNLMGWPADSFVSQAAWGSLGHETGCALGVALGCGKRPVVIAGDGGFRMICQELSSLAEAGCNAVVFVLSNNVYAIEQAFVDIDAFKPEGEFAPFDILPKWDYIALAQALGAHGHLVETVGDLRATLAEVWSVDDTTPALIEVIIPEKDLAPQLARLAYVPPPKRKYRRVPSEDTNSS